jgi:ABC-type Fe3+ transport system permease subunit
MAYRDKRVFGLVVTLAVSAGGFGFIYFFVNGVPAYPAAVSALSIFIFSCLVFFYFFSQGMPWKRGEGTADEVPASQKEHEQGKFEFMIGIVSFVIFISSVIMPLISVVITGFLVAGIVFTFSGLYHLIRGRLMRQDSRAQSFPRNSSTSPSARS